MEQLTWNSTPRQARREREREKEGGREGGREGGVWVCQPLLYPCVQNVRREGGGGLGMLATALSLCAECTYSQDNTVYEREIRKRLNQGSK